ncbi:MAG: hypothetical protein AUK35_06335 [Zetaproteobacteria bacterium CG2_30_46_52]|nr:MAG: hypothetical protein AUK35_06335 [Zetaproteobacteria bacterium CG2_30_46_52]
MIQDSRPDTFFLYRNPERNEKIGSGSTSKHMLGRALDISINDILDLVSPSGVTTPSFWRGATFNKAWEVIHGGNPVATVATSAAVPYADLWQLEGRDGPSDVILIGGHGTWRSGFLDTLDSEDNNRNGIADGYERTGHLHLQDNPSQGTHL